MSAWMEHHLSDDILAEQKKVEEADLIIFQVRGHASSSLATTVVQRLDEPVVNE